MHPNVTLRLNKQILLVLNWWNVALVRKVKGSKQAQLDFVQSYSTRPMLYCSQGLHPSTCFMISSYAKPVNTLGHLCRCLAVLLQASLRFLYNRLALVIYCDSHLSSITLPWQLLSVIKVVLVYQILHMWM